MFKAYEERYEELKERFGYNHGVRKQKKLLIGQQEAELKATYNWLSAYADSNPINVFVELGVNWGATLFMYSAFVQPGGTLIGIDAGLFPGIHDVHKVIDALRADGFTVYFLNERTDESGLASKAHFLANSDFDLLHIDADHSYEVAKHDWETYEPLTKKGGAILFHDITYMKGVAKYWAQIKGALKLYQEIVLGGQGMACIVKE